MSLPHNGSTAPTITSPDLAWPAKPLSRPSPLSTPSSESYNEYPSSSYPSRQASTSTAISSPSEIRRSVSSSIKGKERAIESFELRIHPDDDDRQEELDLEEEEEKESQKERNYGPPKKPLGPHQLGRIAQSFGIIIPNLPQASQYHSDPPLSSSSSLPNSRRPSSPASTSAISPALPSSSTSRGRLSPLLLSSQPPIRSTPFLLSVIPPLCILPPHSSGSSTPEELHRRNKKWRRGRLLPLQPTLGSMLVCIAREYGLPSTIGIYVYLVLPSGQTKNQNRGEVDGSSSSNESNYSSSEIDEPTGPQISSSTWSTLFASHLVQLASGSRNFDQSRSSTPSQTPLKSTVHGSYNGDTSFGDYPLSPLSSMSRIHSSTSQPTSLGRHKQSMKRSKSTEPPELSHSHSSNPSTSSSSVILPPTPTSLATGTNYTISPLNPIVGTIEFDIDLDEAKWYENYKSNRSRGSMSSSSGGKGRHKRSLTAEGGIKELNLVNKAADIRPRFLKELDPNTNMNRPSPEKQCLQVNETQDIRSTSASLDEYVNDGSEEDDIKVGDEEGLLKPDEGNRMNELLASPIELAPEERVLEMDQTTRLKVQEILDKRGSGLVMAEQLDDLEKMMRQLSPREIRITSPRMLTPRMAAKVANLTLPAVPNRSTSKAAPTSSPLAGGFTSPNPNDDMDSTDEIEEKSQPNSARSNGTFGSTINLLPSTDQQQRQQQQQQQQQPYHEQQNDAGGIEEQFNSPRPVWPTKKHSSPGSPTINEYFSRPSFPGQHTGKSQQQQQRNVSSPASISTETLQRMKDEKEKESHTVVLNKSSEWIPRRPARPPSPKLEHQRTLSHTLSPEFVEFLHRSPPPSTTHDIANSSPGNMNGISSPDNTDGGRKRNRSGSISLKGLRNQMSSKNLSQMWKSSSSSGHDSNHPHTQDLPSPPLPNGQKETIGLFRGGLPNESEYGVYTGMRDREANGGAIRSVSSPVVMPNSASSTTTDFGPSLESHNQDELGSVSMSNNHTQTSSGSGTGSGNGKSKFTSRIWGFRHHSDKGDRSSKASSKRNPSIDGGSSIKISDPIPASFIHNDSSFDVPSQSQAQQAALGHGRFPSHSYSGPPPPIPNVPPTPASPNSNGNPASPRSVRRKPVPGQPSAMDNDESLVKNSMSLNSMASFVLEDAPKGRRPAGGNGMMLGQAQ